MKKIFILLSLAISVSVSAADTGSITSGAYSAGGLATGTGVKLAEDSQSRFHLALDTGLGWNTNPYSYAIGQAELVGYYGDLVLKIKPTLSLMAGGKKLSLQMGIDGTSGALLGVGPKTQSNFLVFTGHAGGRGEFNKEGAVSLFAQGNLSTSRQLTQLFLGSMTNLGGDISAGTTIRPGTGPVALTVDGQFQIQNFINLETTTDTGPTAIVPSNLDNYAMYGHGRLSWDATSKINLFVDAKYGSWMNESVTKQGLSINPLWVSGGFRFPIGNHITTTVSAGYADARIQNAGVAVAAGSVPVGVQVDAAWALTSTTNLQLGLGRSLSPTPLFLDTYSNALNIRFDQRFAQKFVFVLTPSVSYMQFGKPWNDGNTPAASIRTDPKKYGKEDLAVDLQGQLTYYIRDWFGIGVSGLGNWRWTNIAIADATTSKGQYVSAAGMLPTNMLYNRYEGVLFLSFNY